MFQSVMKNSKSEHSSNIMFPIFMLKY
jgi:hypothetical protein